MTTPGVGGPTSAQPGNGRKRLSGPAKDKILANLGRDRSLALRKQTLERIISGAIEFEEAELASVATALSQYVDEPELGDLAKRAIAKVKPAPKAPPDAKPATPPHASPPPRVEARGIPDHAGEPPQRPADTSLRDPRGNDEVSRLERELKAANDEVKRLTERANELGRRIDIKQDEVDRLSSTIHRLDVDLTAARDGKRIAETTRDELRQSNETLLGNLERQRGELDAAQRELGELREQVRKLEEDQSGVSVGSSGFPLARYLGSEISTEELLRARAIGVEGYQIKLGEIKGYIKLAIAFRALIDSDPTQKGKPKRLDMKVVAEALHSQDIVLVEGAVKAVGDLAQRRLLDDPGAYRRELLGLQTHPDGKVKVAVGDALGHFKVEQGEAEVSEYAEGLKEQIRQLTADLEQAKANLEEARSTASGLQATVDAHEAEATGLREEAAMWHARSQELAAKPSLDRLPNALRAILGHEGNRSVDILSSQVASARRELEHHRSELQSAQEMLEELSPKIEAAQRAAEEAEAKLDTSVATLIARANEDAQRRVDEIARNVAEDAPEVREAFVALRSEQINRDAREIVDFAESGRSFPDIRREIASQRQTLEILWAENRKLSGQEAAAKEQIPGIEQALRDSAAAAQADMEEITRELEAVYGVGIGQIANQLAKVAEVAGFIGLENLPEIQELTAQVQQLISRYGEVVEAAKA